MLDLPNLVIFPLFNSNKGFAYLPNWPTHSNWPIWLLSYFSFQQSQFISIFPFFIFSYFPCVIQFSNFPIFHYFCLFFPIPYFPIVQFPKFPFVLFPVVQFFNVPISPHYVLKKSCLLCLIQTVIKIVQYGNCLISHFHNFNSFPVFWFSMCPCFLFPFLKI